MRLHKHVEAQLAALNAAHDEQARKAAEEQLRKRRQHGRASEAPRDPAHAAPRHVVDMLSVHKSLQVPGLTADYLTVCAEVLRLMLVVVAAEPKRLRKALLTREFVPIVCHAMCTCALIADRYR